MEGLKKAFASDNYAGVHPEIMSALQACNASHARSYGEDPFTARATQTFKNIFGGDCEVFFVYNGTGANVLGLSAMLQSFQSVICSAGAHINVDESTAPEKFTGAKLLTIPSEDGKIYPDQVELKISRLGDQHHPQVKVISISQATEYGTVFQPEEIKSLSSIAKKHNLFLHMDGARIANAAVSLSLDFRSFTRDAGIDVLSFGGCKNGMMFGEAVVFFNSQLTKNFMYIRKQGMQLHSKMRYIAIQFEALLTNDLWKRNASHANRMARLLEGELKKIPGITITQKVEANGVFAILPPAVIPRLQEAGFFYVWNEKLSEVRLMCSWDTTEEEVLSFSTILKKEMEKV